MNTTITVAGQPATGNKTIPTNNWAKIKLYSRAVEPAIWGIPIESMHPRAGNVFDKTWKMADIRRSEVMTTRESLSQV